MSYDFELSCTLPASPEAIYEAWLEQRRARRDDRGQGQGVEEDRRRAIPLGTATSVGKNIELAPGRADRAVLAHERVRAPMIPNSTITITLTPLKAGARLTLVAISGVPDGQTSYEEQRLAGTFYFEPMTAYFARKLPHDAEQKELPTMRNVTFAALLS